MTPLQSLEWISSKDVSAESSSDVEESLGLSRNYSSVAESRLKKNRIAYVAIKRPHSARGHRSLHDSAFGIPKRFHAYLEKNQNLHLFQHRSFHGKKKLKSKQPKKKGYKTKKTKNKPKKNRKNQSRKLNPPPIKIEFPHKNGANYLTICQVCQTPCQGYLCIASTYLADTMTKRGDFGINKCLGKFSLDGLLTENLGMRYQLRCRQQSLMVLPVGVNA